MNDYVGSSKSSDVNSDEWELSGRKKIIKLDGNKTTREFLTTNRAKKTGKMQR